MDAIRMTLSASSPVSATPQPAEMRAADRFCGSFQAVPQVPRLAAGLAQHTSSSSAPPPESVRPTAGDFELYVPDGDGFTLVRQVPCRDVRESFVLARPGGTEQRYLFARGNGSRSLLSLDVAGHVSGEFAVPYGDGIAQVLPDPARDRILVRTGAALRALDPVTLGTVAERKFDGGSDYTRNLLFRRDGSLVLTNGKTVETLDDSLNPASTFPVGVQPRQVREMADGSLYLLQDSDPTAVVVMGRDGSPRLDVHDAEFASVITDPQEQVWLVERSYARPVGQVVHFDPTTGRTERFEGTRETRSAIPVAGGRFMLFDDRWNEPVLRLCKADGAPVREFHFGHGGHLSQFLLSERDDTAFAVVNHYDGDLDQPECILYRMDLADPGSVPPESGMAVEEAREVCRRVREDGVIPAILDDTRILIFERGGIDVLSSEGALETHVDHPRDLPAALHGARVVTRRLKVGLNTAEDIRADLDAFVARATERFRHDGNPDLARAHGSTMDFRSSVPRTQALVEIGVRDEEGYRSLFAQNPFGTLFTHRLDVAYPGDGAKRATVEKASIRVEMGGRCSEFRLAEPETFVTALAVDLGGRPCVAAASSEGMLYWYDPLKARGPDDIPSFRIGERVVGLSVGPDNTVRVTAADGRVGLYRPPLPPGVALVGVQSESSRNQAGPPDGARVVVERDRVIIGGIALPRNRAS